MIKHAFELIAVARKLMMVASNVGSYFKKVWLSPNDDAGYRQNNIQFFQILNKKSV